MIQLTIHADESQGVIAPEIYGHFAEHLGHCIYGGIYVGEDSDIPNFNGLRCDVVNALRELRVPVLRWPGGCFAEEYRWRDGIGPKAQRRAIVNAIWGGAAENNHFGTHEYMELCRQIGCKTYINGSVSYATSRENGEWLEYMTFPGGSPLAELRARNGHPEAWHVDYFGVGNENWGAGGHMLPEFYGNLYRQYQTYVRSCDGGKPVQRVCVGPSGDDYEWTEQVLKTCFRRSAASEHGFMDLLSLHYYVVPGTWEKKGSATEFSEEEWYRTLFKALYMETLITRHTEILNRFDPDGRIGLAVDEWGDWFDPEPGTNPAYLCQQNTMRDALAAGITLSIFNRHCDRVRLACLAQMVNVLQAVILTDGGQMLRTPTYHVMHLYRHHQGATLLKTDLTGVPEIGPENCPVPAVVSSVSDKDGVLTVTLNHLSASKTRRLQLRLSDGDRLTVQEAAILTGAPCGKNTFDAPDTVAERPFTGYTAEEGGVTVTLPPCSVVLLRCRRETQTVTRPARPTATGL